MTEQLWIERERLDGWQRSVLERWGMIQAAPSVTIEDRGQAIERMLDARWQQHLKRVGAATFNALYAEQWMERERPNVVALLAAAEGRET